MRTSLTRNRARLAGFSPFPIVITRLCIVRHGETDWNAGRRIQGQIDVPLSAVGHAQARATGNALGDEGFAALYSSDLIRARQTAEALAHLAHRPLQLHAGLRERHYGAFQGLTYAEAETRHPADYARHKARDVRFAPAGGESLLGFSARLADTFDEILRRHAGTSVAVFTHGGVLDILYRQATQRPLDTPRDFVIPNCGINWFEVANGCWTLLSWAEREHLDRTRDEL
ncbi:MAG: 2,3-bisphosphoglycerate-dependent phosphoglycerate mutase [Pseudomonadota bacterium]|nr:2,3-bisphosphoglycerate-dependent phosphoglycerate mutase [Pseudomonadota bacterium]